MCFLLKFVFELNFYFLQYCNTRFVSTGGSSERKPFFHCFLSMQLCNSIFITIIQIFRIYEDLGEYWGRGHLTTFIHKHTHTWTTSITSRLTDLIVSIMRKRAYPSVLRAYSYQSLGTIWVAEDWIEINHSQGNHPTHCTLTPNLNFLIESLVRVLDLVLYLSYSLMILSTFGRGPRDQI